MCKSTRQPTSAVTIYWCHNECPDILLDWCRLNEVTHTSVWKCKRCKKEEIALQEMVDNWATELINIGDESHVRTLFQ